MKQIMLIVMVVAAVGSAVAAKHGVTTGLVANASVKITSKSASYDNKEGFAYFSGNVYVDDSEYQLHADRAYVFTDGSNSLKRITAIGHVALTNGTRRAYGGKASYYRKSGLVVLNSSDDAPAEVRDEAQGGDQVLRGKKIRFWTGTRQVDVEEAWISAPRSAGATGQTVREVFRR